jgi:hypothetical protein
VVLRWPGNQLGVVTVAHEIKRRVAGGNPARHSCMFALPITIALLMVRRLLVFEAPPAISRDLVNYLD